MVEVGLTKPRSKCPGVQGLDFAKRACFQTAPISKTNDAMDCFRATVDHRYKVPVDFLYGHITATPRAAVQVLKASKAAATGAKPSTPDLVPS